MMCEACENNQHYLCGMQTWCECDCDGDASPDWNFDEDNEDTHTETYTCEACLQNHPERDILYGEGDYFEWEKEDENEEI